MNAPGTLPARTSVPRITGLVHRPRLFERLAQARAHPLLWLSGPPGAGKSALLASWLHSVGVPALWWEANGSTDGLAALAALLPADLEAPAQARAFFTALFAAYPRGVVLVLDNLERAPVLAAQLREAAEAVPEGACILVASRLRPPAALARHIAHGAAVHLDALALQFDADEALALARARGYTASEQITALRDWCEGWAAGLSIALGAAHGAGAALLDDYLGAEAFHALPASLRAALLCIAPLPRFSQSMAHALLGDAATALLDHARVNDGFIGLEAEGTLRIHPLFRGFLRTQLARERAPDAVRSLERRAARLLGDAGAVDAALDLLRDAGDAEGCATLLAAHAAAAAGAGRWKALARWLAQVPPKAAADPRLTYWQAVLQIGQSPVLAQASFERAWQAFRTRGDRAGELRAATGAIQSILAQADTYQGLDAWMDVLAAHVQDLSALDASEHVNVWCAFLQAALLRRPGHPLLQLGIGWLEAGIESGRFSPSDMAAAGAVLLLYGCVTADDAVVRRTVAATAAAAHGDAAQPIARWSWHYWHGLFWLWRLEYAHAVACWEHCTRISVESGLQALDWLVHGNLTMVDLAEDRFEDAQRRLALLRQAGSEGHMNAYALYWMGETFLRLYQRRADLPEAVNSMVDSARRTGFFNLEMLCLSDAAAVHLLREEDAQARELIEEVAARVAGTVMHQSDGQVMALRAGLAFREGRIDEAHVLFAQALDLVARGGTCACMLWVRAGLSTLFAAALDASAHTTLVRDLVRQYQVPAPPRAPSAWPWPVRIRALGRLQIEVNGGPLAFGRKPQQKVLELLKALVVAGGRDVDSAQLADWLWPDAEGDASQSNLRVTVKRLRDLLRHPEAVRQFDGKLSLNERICWLDVWSFHDWCASALDDEAASTLQVEISRQVRTLYRGPLLDGEGLPWIEGARQRERRRLARLLARLSAQDEHSAGGLRDHALLVDPDLALA